MKRVTMYRCDTCGGLHEYMGLIYSCICCGKEICDECVYDYRHCLNCKAVTTQEQRKQAFYAQDNK